MAGSYSDFLENKLLDNLFGATAYTVPGTLYVALFTAAPTDAGGGTEVSGGSYARKAVTNNTTNWPNASGGSKSNGALITFATPSANWGTVVAFAIFDALTAGNMLAWADLTTSKTINNGDPAPEFAIGALVITLT